MRFKWAMYKTLAKRIWKVCRSKILNGNKRKEKQYHQQLWTHPFKWDETHLCSASFCGTCIFNIWQWCVLIQQLILALPSCTLLVITEIVIWRLQSCTTSAARQPPPPPQDNILAPEMILQFPFYWVNARTSPVQFQVSPEPESEIMYPGEDIEALYLL